MSLLVIIVIALVAAALVGALVIVGMKASKLGEELESAEHKIESLQGECRALVHKMAVMQDEDRKKIGLLDHADQEINHYREQLDQRPETKRKTYRILTLGMKATGKTSLTLKWSNPLIDLGTIEGTKIERYERSVSRVQSAKDITEHLFEVHDWGGEHIVDALQELMTEEIHGLLVVVDLGGKNAKQVEMSRVEEQLQEFQPQALRYFFGPKTLASCKTVVLFINKSDLIAGTPEQVEEQAKRLYKPLIDNLTKYANQIDVKVFVGSASSGHSTHHLFAHFVEKILPAHAYDTHLLQRMKTDCGITRVPTSTKNASPPSVPAFAPPPMPPSRQQLSPTASTFGATNGHGFGHALGLGDTAPLVHRGNGVAQHMP